MDNIDLIQTYTAMGQLWGMAEILLDETEPDVSRLLEIYDSLSPERQKRLRWLYDAIPQQYVIEMVAEAKREEAVSGIPITAVTGQYWPKTFYLFAQAWFPTSKNGKAVMELFHGPGPIVV